MKKPKFKHDCEDCQFVPIVGADHYDIYVCPQHGVPTVVCRFSDEGSDYQSVPLDMIFNLVVKQFEEKKE